MPQMTRKTTTLLAGAALALGLTGAAVAQTTVNELTITGRWTVGDNVRSLSAAVPYSDLDLNTSLGRSALKERVRTTANDLCDRLGESNSAPTVGRSCQQDAMISARDAIKVAIASQQMPNYAYLDDAYVAPAGETVVAATDVTTDASATVTDVTPTVTTQTVTNGPVPDTRENRARYGGPMSHGGRMTRAAGN